MGPSTWPEMEISPRNEDILLQAARLRPFGVNYLQGAICPNLGLLAHLDGSSVHLFPFPPCGNPDNPWGACIASIDLSARTRTSNPGGIDGRGVPCAGERGGGCPPAGVARGLSWTQSNRPQLTKSPSVDVSAAAAAPVAPERLGASGRGSHVEEGVKRDDGSNYTLGEEVGGAGGGTVSAHLAVACGSKVRIWEVSRLSGLGGAGEAHQLEENESCADRQYRYSTVEVLTDWHRTVGNDCSGDPAAAAGGMKRKDDQDGDNDEGNAASGDVGGAQPEGKGFRASHNNVRCMAFRPGGGDDARKPEGEYNEEGVPLAVWYDTGAAVLGPGEKRTTFSAPVAKKRACGAWSGCGQYLATSSGGEIRVHTNPSRKHTLEAMGDVDADVVNASAEQPARVVEAWAGSDSTATYADGVLVTEDNEGTPAPWAKIVQESGPGESGGHFEGSSFRTVLCVEAALCDGSSSAGGGGGGLSSPGSSAGRSSSPSPRSTPSRRRVPSSGRHGLNDLTPPPSFAHMPSSAHKRDTERICNLSSNAGLPGNHSSKPSASSKVLMGDMRAMCPAGPSAFFGTTDGGLGVGSLFGGGSPGGSLTAVNTCDGRGGQDLLGAVVGDSEARIAASDATDAALSFRDYSSPMQKSVDGGDGCGQDGDKHTRRGGFRHVLPGENWLAGSLRPRSRAPPTQSLQKASRSAELLSSMQPSRNTEGEANTVAGDVPNLAKTAEAHITASSNALDGGLLLGAPNSTLTGSLPPSANSPEVLDLRGKIGGVHAMAGGGAAVPGVASTHPLFRLALDGGIDPALQASSGSTATPTIYGVDIGGAVIGGVGGVTSARGASKSYGDTADAPSRRPWLMRVSCSSRTAGSNDPNGAGSDGVRVKTLAALPLELTSPDLLASSDDGSVVAVGSHASGLVACYRLSVHPVEGGRPASGPPASRAREEEKKSRSGDAEGLGSANGASAGRLVNAAWGGGVRRRRRKRLAVPLCTLRLPSEYRAKGLTLVKDGSEGRGGGGEGNGDRELKKHEDAESVGTVVRAGVTTGDSGGSGSPMSAAGSTGRGDGVAVLVLAGCPVTDPNAGSQPLQGVMAKGSLLASRSLGKSAAELSYRTVLLRFSLLEITAGGSDDKKRSPCFTACTDERGYPMETSGRQSMASHRNKDASPHARLGSSDCLSGHGRRVGGSSEARAGNDVGLLRHGEGDESGQRSFALAVDTGCASPAGKQKAVAPPCRNGNQRGGVFSEGGGLLQDELTRSSLFGGGGRETSGSCAGFGVDDGDCYGAVARDALNVPEGARSACGQLVGGDDSGGRGTGSNASVGRQWGKRFEVTLLEGLAGQERRLGERLDRMERLMLGMWDKVGALERSLGDLSRGNPGEKLDG